MTSVNITTTKNTVTVNEGDSTIVTVATQGPQGPGFDLTLDHSAKVDGSVIYYDSASGKVKLDATTTKLTLVNGGNFQAMSNTIRIKKRAASGSAGAPSALAPSEIAFNENSGDLKLYYGLGDDGSGEATSIIVIGGPGGFVSTTETRTANTILAGPTTGSAAAPTFRALVAGDLLKLNQFTAPDASVSLNSQKITNLATPTASTDAASKSYVDGVSQGLDVKDSVVATTTTNGALSSAFANGQTIDGVSLSTNDRILIKDQSTQTENGIYKVNASGAPTRVDDLATGADAAGAFVFVEQGTANADNGFVCTSNKGSAVVGTNNLTFAQFSGAGSITAGDGLQKSGNTISADLKANGGLVIESSELAIDLAASSITGSLPVTKLLNLDSTLTELNKLNGLNSTTTELNTCTDGDTSATATTLALADRMVVNDAGTMKQVAFSDLVTFLEDGSTSGLNINGGTF